MDFENQAHRERLVATARALAPLAFAKALLSVSPALLRIHEAGMPDISWAYSLNRTPLLLPTTLDKWAAVSHPHCSWAARRAGSFSSVPDGLALYVGHHKALAVWGIAIDVAQSIVAETAILAGLLTPAQVRACLGPSYDPAAGERIRLQFDAVNAS